MLDLKLLKTFVVMGRLLHFGRAAEALHSTQPGVTQHISRLEEQLGFELLKRNKRSVMLTDAGVLFLRYANRLLLLADRMEEEARSIASGRGGKLALGLSSAIVYSGVPERISAFKRVNPGIEVKLVVHSGDMLQELLDAYAIDAAVTTLPFSGDEYCSTVLDAETPMGVALPVNHPLAGQSSVSIHSLSHENFVVVPRGKHPQAYDSLTSLLHSTGSTARISGHEVSFPNLVARVAMGEGLALVPLAYANMAPSSVRVVKVTDPELAHLKIYLVTKTDCEHTIIPRFNEAMVA
jgi:DNA-binding transcriptional LysR family regulator